MSLEDEAKEAEREYLQTLKDFCGRSPEPKVRALIPWIATASIITMKAVVEISGKMDEMLRVLDCRLLQILEGARKK